MGGGTEPRTRGGRTIQRIRRLRWGSALRMTAARGTGRATLFLRPGRRGLVPAWRGEKVDPPAEPGSRALRPRTILLRGATLLVAGGAVVAAVGLLVPGA